MLVNTEQPSPSSLQPSTALVVQPEITATRVSKSAVLQVESV